MNKPILEEWEEKFEKIVLEEAVIKFNATPEVGEPFDVDKLNYTNKLLNDITSFIYEKGRENLTQALQAVRKEAVEDCIAIIFSHTDGTTYADMAKEMDGLYK